MAFSTVTRRLMLDWIRNAIDEGADLPTDEAIAGKFGFDSTQQARELLATLSDAGEITLRGSGPDREILIGRVKPGALKAVSRPAPSVRKAEPVDPEVDRAVEKILNIVGGSKASHAASAGTVLARATKAATDAAPAAAQAIAKQVTDPKLNVQAIEPKLPHAAQVRGRHQVAPSLLDAEYAELVRRAAVTGETVTAAARNILVHALALPAPRTREAERFVLRDIAERAAHLGVTIVAEAEGKAFMPAGAFRAAQIAGASIHDFASMLIRIGLETYLAREAA